MHATPWLHATDIPNAPAVNLVQIGIGGWQAPRAGCLGSLVRAGRLGRRAARLSRQAWGPYPD